ncbi:MAG: hypothetical protein IJO74_01780 [Clostridia bacterium]|nr:hypothetical protein [Clostridia bacterium]
MLSSDEIREIETLLETAEREFDALKNQDYIKRVVRNIKRLDKKTDMELISAFHKKYAQKRGNGLVEKDIKEKAFVCDTVLQAYKMIFFKRRICRVYARCSQNHFLGYRVCSLYSPIININDWVCPGIVCPVCNENKLHI